MRLAFLAAGDTAKASVVDAEVIWRNPEFRTEGELVDALVKMKTTPQTRIEIMQIAEVFRAKVVDICKGTLTLELTGPEEKIQALVDLMKPFGIKEVVRTGIIAMARGSHLAAERAPEDGGMTEPETAADAASPPA